MNIHRSPQIYILRRRSTLLTMNDYLERPCSTFLSSSGMHSQQMMGWYRGAIVPVVVIR